MPETAIEQRFPTPQKVLLQGCRIAKTYSRIASKVRLLQECDRAKVAAIRAASDQRSTTSSIPRRPHHRIANFSRKNLLNERNVPLAIIARERPARPKV